MANVMRKFHTFAGVKARFSFKFPSKWKEERLERYKASLKQIAMDYKTVVVELKDDMKAKPIKTLLYFTGFGILGVTIKTSPDEKSFRSKLIENSHDLMLLGEPIRNPVSDQFTQNCLTLIAEERLHYINLGIISLVYYTKYGKNNNVYEARCPQLQPRWRDFKDYIIDVGLFGNWIYLNKSMEDYDVNPNEWGGVRK